MSCASSFAIISTEFGISLTSSMDCELTVRVLESEVRGSFDECLASSRKAIDLFAVRSKFSTVLVLEY